MRTIHMTVAGDSVELDSAVAGVQGSGNVDKLVVRFDPAWEGYAKSACWWDAHGARAGEPRLLTADMLVDIARDTSSYILLVPPAALAYAGRCSLVIDGWKDGTLARTVTQEFQVVPAPAPSKEDYILPDQAQQMQAQVEALLPRMQVVLESEASRGAAEEARRDAEEAREAAEAERRAVSAEIVDNARVAAQAAREDADRASERAEAAWDAMNGAEDACGWAEDAQEAAEEAQKEAESARNAAEKARDAARDARDAAQSAADDAGNAASNAEDSANDAADAAKTAQGAAQDAEVIQAALHSRRRVRFGTAADVADLLPGDTLIIIDDSSAANAVDYRDLILEAQKAACGAVNRLESMAVLSVVNATNWRRDAEGRLWTTDTMADFRSRLTEFAAAAVAGGYVDADGRCVATWAQAQAWFISGALLTPLDAEEMYYPWRMAAPRTELDDVKDRMSAIEAQLGYAAKAVNTLIKGGNKA